MNRRTVFWICKMQIMGLKGAAVLMTKLKCGPAVTPYRPSSVISARSRLPLARCASCSQPLTCWSHRGAGRGGRVNQTTAMSS